MARAAVLREPTPTAYGADLLIWFVNAFSRQRFGGNPCAVAWSDRAISNASMQAVAAELQQPATAFARLEGGQLSVRWFTPQGREIAFCGHGAVAALKVASMLDLPEACRGMTTVEGRRAAGWTGGEVWVDLPPLPLGDGPLGCEVERALGVRPTAVRRGRDLVAVFDGWEDLRKIRLDVTTLASIDTYALVATAPGGPAGEDYSARFFKADKIDGEDHVNGFSQAYLAPYWSARFGRRTLSGRQLSRRGGEFRAEVGKEVRLVADANVTLTGTMPGIDAE